MGHRRPVDDDGGEGLAAERTALAWGRTSLALMACGAAVLAGLPSAGGRRGRPRVGSVIVALAAGLWVHALWSERRRRVALGRGAPAAGAAVLRTTAAATALVGLAALAVELLL